MSIIPREKMVRVSLPPELICDDFIMNYSSSYEEYLTEFVNCSKIFQELSHGTQYTHTPKNKQSCGECDCCSDSYEVDFKILGTQSSMQVNRIHSKWKCMLNQGVLFTFISPQREDMAAYYTHNLLRNYTLSDLQKIDKMSIPPYKKNDPPPEADIQAILKAAKCKKNVLFFFKDFLYAEGEYSAEAVVEAVTPFINECFANLFRYRDIEVPNKDTFLAAIIQNRFCFARWDGDLLQFEEILPLQCSNRFLELFEMADIEYKKHLKVR